MGLVTSYAPVSNYFKAIDITAHESIMTIAAIVETTYPANQDGPARTEPALQFVETPKVFGLNKTNREKLAELFGTPEPTTGCMDVEPEMLVGQKIALYKATTQNKTGATVPCVRIRAARAAAPVRKAPQAVIAASGKAAPVRPGLPPVRQQAQPLHAEPEPEPGSFDEGISIDENGVPF